MYKRIYTLKLRVPSTSESFILFIVLQNVQRTNAS